MMRNLTRENIWEITNSLAPGKFEWNFRHVIFKQILVIDGWGIFCEIALMWMSLDFTDDQSTLVQVMAWCRQATTITWANVDPDLCHHMVSLGHNELITKDNFLKSYLAMWSALYLQVA